MYHLRDSKGQLKAKLSNSLADSIMRAAKVSPFTLKDDRTAYRLKGSFKYNIPNMQLFIWDDDYLVFENE